MAIYLPIISQFSDKGIARAKREFRSLEGAAAKTKFVLRQAFAGATAALGGLGVAAFSATKAAVADAKAQAELARQLAATTGATADQIAAVEDWIATQGKVLGITDDELRPAYGKLSRVLKDQSKIQDVLALAMDASAASGKDLNTVTEVFAKALGGNIKALSRTFPQYKKLIDSGASIEEVFAAIAKQVGGAASTAANTSAGKFQRLQVRMDELKESIGAQLLPIIEKFVPYLEKMATWAEKNQGIVLALAGAIGVLATGIVAANIAITLSNPFTAIAVGIAALVTGLVVAYKKFEWFRKAVDWIMGMIRRYFELVINAWITVINGIIRGYNLANGIWGGKDIELLGRVDLTPDNRAGSSAANARRFEQSQVVVNNYAANPQAVVDALRQASRQQGGITGVKIR
jgi:hypothetical protein